MNHFLYRRTISTYSSGTGAAGIIGSFLYTGLKQVGLSTGAALISQLFMPFLAIFAFWIILRAPKGYRRNRLSFQPVHYGTVAPIPVVPINDSDNHDESLGLGEDLLVPSMFILPIINQNENIQKQRRQSIKEEIFYVPSVAKYIIPLTANYFFNYFINQTLVCYSSLSTSIV